MRKVTLWAENYRLRTMVHGLRRQLESAQARLAESGGVAMSGAQTAWKAQRREWDEDYAELERQLAEARAECRARIQRKIDLMREREPIDDRRPGWYWDGWHAALDAIEEVLAGETKP